MMGEMMGRLVEGMEKGTKYTNRKGKIYEVVECENSAKVRVRFIDSGYEAVTIATSVRKGLIRDKSQPYSNPGIKLVCGVGMNDADYQLSFVEKVEGAERKYKLIWRCPFYQVWFAMINRCYSERSGPTYANCSVCESWLTFSTFKAWMEQQDWQGKQLDKDLLVPNNKEYHPDRCIFITHRVNSFMIEVGNARGEWPIGVYLDKSSGKFTSLCRDINSCQKHLGTFHTPEEAHEAWLRFKTSVAEELAAGLDDNVAAALIDRYKNYKNYFT